MSKGEKKLLISCSIGKRGGVMDYDDMSNNELCLLLKERMPAAVQTVKEVTDFNRETVIAFLKVLLML